MGFPIDASAKNYSSTGANNTSKFIPQIWSKKLLVKFYDQTVFGAIANTDYEGEIKNYGDEVIIRTRADITVNDYVKGAGITYEQPESPTTNLVINQGKYFAFKLYDVDRVQSDLALMDEWSQDGAEQMKIKVDTDILSAIPAMAGHAGLTAGADSNISLGTTATPLSITNQNIVETIVEKYGVIMDEQNMPESNRFVVLPPALCARLKTSDLKDASITGDGKSTLRSGRIGMLDRFTIYSSNNLNRPAAGQYDVVFGHQCALTFAAQISFMEKLKNPDDFGDLARSLMVYGYNVIKPEGLGHSVLTLGA
ncbi:hypothetical protein [Bowmanella sp. JS7-9]|uniref:Capsid protein n=1 Tax=Pseudobowmanella zhangzhouensis TaxID=1537679 RepID=A0ABW1XQS2_9ALTE|nr:hypothetical protein [Bowmanella sp. JS7-9]TBX21920.1 hypothetical protein TK45_10555 [Bowmanella sp. JS7-9]